MPKKPINYSKGLIYRLVCRDIGVKEIYVGSTTDFASRKSQHKTACHNPNAKDHNYKVYRYMREHGGFDNWDMVLIEYFPCANEYELNARERHWIEQLGATLNCQIPTRTIQEWREDNKEVLSEKHKQWCAENAQHRTDYGKQYYTENADVIAEKGQAYREANKEVLKIRQQQWYAKNAEKIAAARQESFLCQCGSSVTLQNKSRHLKSQMHINKMLSLSAPPEVAQTVS